MARSPARLDTPPFYPAYVPEPDVWWGKDGIDADRGLEASPYEPPPLPSDRTARQGQRS